MSKNVNPLTPKQKKILDFITKFVHDKEYAPSLEEIAKHFRLNSASTVHQYIQALIEKGYLDKDQNVPRSIELKPRGEVEIPLLGYIAAGEPIEAISNPEPIKVPKTMLAKSGLHYALKVKGNSMIHEGIYDGDTVIIRRQETAENGQKVVALLNGNEVTLKKLYRENGRIRLQPANPNIKPIYIDPSRIVIQGIVMDVIQNVKQKIYKEPSLRKPKSKKTVYQKLPLNQIICGDAIEELRKIPDESVDIIIADPPYNIGKDFGNNQDKRELDEYVEWSKLWINECIRTMKNGATMFIYGFSEILANLSVEIPLNKRWLIWHYTNKNVASLNFWQRSHEAIICTWKGKPIFNRDEIREPYTEGFLNGAAGKIRKGTVGRFSKGEVETIYKAHEGGALPRDVIKIPALAGGAGMVERWFLCKTCNDVFEPRQLQKHNKHEVIKHPTQKPLELSRKLILSAMPKKDSVVLVPFVGTGSECVAAKELGQSYIGFEINPDYVKIAEKFLKSANFIPKLF